MEHACNLSNGKEKQGLKPKVLPTYPALQDQSELHDILKEKGKTKVERAKKSNFQQRQHGQEGCSSESLPLCTLVPLGIMGLFSALMGARNAD